MQSVTVKAPGGPEVLELTETATPTPGPGEALVKVAYAALNPCLLYTSPSPRDS